MNNAEIIKTLDCPYYEDENILFLNIDCMKLMELLPNKFFNLSICDPPYGINCDKINMSMYTGLRKDGSQRENKKWIKTPLVKKYQDKQWDNKIPDKEYFNILNKISKNIILWGAEYFCEFIKNNGGWIIWDKKISMPSLSKCELAWTSCNNHKEIFKYMWNGFIKEDNEKRNHITQKPVALYLWLLDNYAKPNDLIFDSHVGSASSLIACMQKGFKCIGSELDTDYFNDAIKRIKLERAKLNDQFYLTENDLFKSI